MSTSLYSAPAPLMMPASGPSDEMLMAAIAIGDSYAFTQLVDRHLKRIVRVASRISGSLAEGEDVAQEAFARVWVHAARWRPIGSSGGAQFSSWLYRIVLNIAIDKKRQPGFTSIENVGEPIDESDDGFARIYQGQLSEVVAAAITRLPERQRAVLLLCFFEDHSNLEAARCLHLTVSAVESLLVRARRSLRRELQSTYQELAHH